MKTTQDIINDSGYPLQIYLENLVKTTTEKHGWRVLNTEHRWVNSMTNTEGFIDLILYKWFIRLVIECKRFSGSWNFLNPDNVPGPTHKTKLLEVNFDTFLEGEFYFGWKDSGISPKSFWSEFCVLEVDGKKDSRTLEKISGELLLSTEYLARQEIDVSRKHGATNEMMIFVPIIVTTATLQMVLFNPNDISASDGKISNSTTSEVEFIRFTKNLATELPIETPEFPSLMMIKNLNERTVFIVQANHFIDFLTKLTDF